MIKTAITAKPPHSLSPLVIFGTGGSGTRVVARIVQHACYCLGLNRTASEDSPALADFFERRVTWYLSRFPWIDGLLQGFKVVSHSDENFGEVVREFNEAITQHQSGLPGEQTKWGWKGPRSIFLLPFLHQRYPKMVAIHVVRDGRDMAYSTNQNQLNKHGQCVLSDYERTLPQPVQSMILWSRVNLAAALYGERYLNGSYMCVRFEGLCSDPHRIIPQIFDLLGCMPASERSYEAAVAEVKRPPTISRWQRKSTTEVSPLVNVGEETLRKFGYV